MLFKILTYSGRYVAEALEAGASSVRGSRNRMENARMTNYFLSVHYHCHPASISDHCFVPGHRAKCLAGP